MKTQIIVAVVLALVVLLVVFYEMRMREGFKGFDLIADISGPKYPNYQSCLGDVVDNETKWHVGGPDAKCASNACGLRADPNKGGVSQSCCPMGASYTCIKNRDGSTKACFCTDMPAGSPTQDARYCASGRAVLPKNNVLTCL